MLKFQHIFHIFFQLDILCCAQRASNETVIFWLLRAILLLLSLGVVASQLFAVLKHGIILKNMIEFCLVLATYPTSGITHGTVATVADVDVVDVVDTIKSYISRMQYHLTYFRKQCSRLFPCLCVRLCLM